MPDPEVRKNWIAAQRASLPTLAPEQFNIDRYPAATGASILGGLGATLLGLLHLASGSYAAVIVGAGFIAVGAASLVVSWFLSKPRPDGRAIDVWEKARECLSQGYEHLAEGRLREAKDSFSAAYEASPDKVLAAQPRVVEWLAVLADHLGERDEARRHYLELHGIGKRIAATKPAQASLELARLAMLDGNTAVAVQHVSGVLRSEHSGPLHDRALRFLQQVGTGAVAEDTLRPPSLATTVSEAPATPLSESADPFKA